MHSVKAIAIGLLAWPAAEIVVFFCIAAAIGFINAILLVVVMSLAGIFVLRHFSNGTQPIETAGGIFAASAWRGGIGPGLGGVFLLIPGFLTSALGVAILFPLSRRWLLAGFHRLLATGQRRRRTADPDVIDLTPEEWRPLPSENLPPSGPPEKKLSPSRPNVIQP